MRAEKITVENEGILVKELKNGGTNCTLNRNKTIYAETCWRLGLNRRRFLRRPTCIFSRFPVFSKARLDLLPFCVLRHLCNWHSFSNASINTSTCAKFRYHLCLFAWFLVSGKVLIISLSVAGGVLLVTLCCCIYCCCCRRKRGNG